METKHFGILPFLFVSFRLHFISVMKCKSTMKLYPHRYSNGCQGEVKGNVHLKERNPSRIRRCGAQAGISGHQCGCTQQINDVAPTGWGPMGAAVHADPEITLQ